MNPLQPNKAPFSEWSTCASLLLEPLDQILQSFAPISLEEMDNVQLMNRTDTKFMLYRPLFEEMLPQLAADYSVLEINGVRRSRYETLYYDRPNFDLYIAHQNGKKNRYKVRKRCYVESQINFLEVKFKNNIGRTIKSRIRIPEITQELQQREIQYIESKHLDAHNLEAKLHNDFTRITLVNRTIKERVTIDTDIAYSNTTAKADLKQLVIVEVKQEAVNRHSRFMQLLKEKTIRPEGVSKYCLGVVMLYPQIKSNTFKEKILKIKKLDAQYA